MDRIINKLLLIQLIRVANHHMNELSRRLKARLWSAFNRRERERSAIIKQLGG